MGVQGDLASLSQLVVSQHLPGPYAFPCGVSLHDDRSNQPNWSPLAIPASGEPLLRPLPISLQQSRSIARHGTARRRGWHL